MNQVTLDGEVLKVENDVAFCRHKRPFYTKNTDYIHFHVVDANEAEIRANDIIVVTGEILIDPQDDPESGIVIKPSQVFNTRL